MLNISALIDDLWENPSSTYRAELRTILRDFQTRLTALESVTGTYGLSVPVSDLFKSAPEPCCQRSEIACGCPMCPAHGNLPLRHYYNPPTGDTHPLPALEWCTYPECQHRDSPQDHPIHGDSRGKAETHGWQSTSMEPPWAKALRDWPGDKEEASAASPQASTSEHADVEKMKAIISEDRHAVCNHVHRAMYYVDDPQHYRTLHAWEWCPISAEPVLIARYRGSK